MTDTERQARHKQLAALLARADRLTVDEAALLREHFATELAIADAARRTAGGVTAENRRLRQQVADLTDEAARLRAELAESEQLRQHAGELYLMYREMYYAEADARDRYRVAWWSARQRVDAAVTVPDDPAAAAPAQPADGISGQQETGATQDALRTEVRAALTVAGISQASAARQLGLSQKHLSQMLTGRAPLAIGWADRILALCGLRLHVSTVQPDATDHTCPDGESCPPHDTPAEDDSLDEMTITDDPNDPEQVLVHLPVFGYLDTQAWSVDVGIPRSHLRHLAGLATGTVTTPAQPRATPQEY